MTKRVLVADDKDEMRELLGVYLERAGFDVTTAENGAEAVAEYVHAICAGASFDFLLIDAAMPKLDGFATRDAIRAIEAHEGLQPTKMAFLSAFNDVIDGSNLIKPGETFWHKDETITHVAELIEQQLAQRNSASA